MNRHHPYGAAAYDGGHRRGGTPGGPGPDRSYNQRGGTPRGRGFGRGRGSFHSGYDNGPSGSGSYDQSQSQHQVEVSPYNSYDTGSQDNFYQNGSGSYAGSTPSAQYTTQSASDGYTQGYGNLEGALEIETEHTVRI